MAHAFLKTLAKMPQGSVIGGSIAITCALSAFCLAFFSRNGKNKFFSLLSPDGNVILSFILFFRRESEHPFP
jgi:hypothetical protein